jgi:hypothetical protein
MDAKYRDCSWVRRLSPQTPADEPSGQGSGETHEPFRRTSVHMQSIRRNSMHLQRRVAALSALIVGMTNGPSQAQESGYLFCRRRTRLLRSAPGGSSTSRHRYRCGKGFRRRQAGRRSTWRPGRYNRTDDRAWVGHQSCRPIFPPLVLCSCVSDTAICLVLSLMCNHPQRMMVCMKPKEKTCPPIRHGSQILRSAEP